VKAFVDRGLGVLIPFGQGQRYDLAVQLPDGRFLRVQCKNARYDRGCVIFNSRSTDHGMGRQSYVGFADMFGIYDAASDRVYLIPVSELPGYEGRLRINPTRNNQRMKVRFAKEYEVDRWTADELSRVAAEGQSVQPDLSLVA
jgi:hypothetical protein